VFCRCDRGNRGSKAKLYSYISQVSVTSHEDIRSLRLTSYLYVLGGQGPERVSFNHLDGFKALSTLTTFRSPCLNPLACQSETCGDTDTIGHWHGVQRTALDNPFLDRHLTWPMVDDLPVSPNTPRT
jgi:hypothetical protein